MENFSESRNLYSWWWDSHISPTNSNWLQENLTDMDSKVKAMIKLIEEDADSFARRAEMYYKKRPELLTLVEDFYRAYRALAERYDHLTGELRQAHCTIAEAFPNLVVNEDHPPSRSSVLGAKPHTTEETTEEKDEHLSRKSLQLEADENENIMALASLECEHAVEGECQIYDLQRALQYQICAKKLSNMEFELSQAENESIRLSEQTVQAQIAVQTMKQALARLELEKDDLLAKGNESMELQGDLEGMISHAKENLEGLSPVSVVKAENEFATIESETKAGLQTYNICLEKISYLEGKIPMAEENVRILKQHADRAKNDVSTLRQSRAELNEEKESSFLQYTSYLKKASKLETVLSCHGEQVQKLYSGVPGEAFARQIVLKDQEIFRKQNELEDFQVEHLCCSQIEAMLQTLISTQSQAQEDNKALALELKAELEMLKRLELCKCELENEIRHVKVENQSLRDEKMTATMSIDNLQNEILCLKMIKERLEEEAAQQNLQTNSLQTEISSITKEMEGLNNGYQCLVQKLESAGLNTDMICSSIKCLQVENSKLRQDREIESTEKQVLSKKLEDMEELSKKKDILESSLSQLHGELEASHKEVKELQDKSQFLHGACSVLISEKAAILAQLQTLTENLQKVFNKNAVLENSLSGAKIELEGLKEKSKSLEEICHLLKNEKFILLNQQGTLVVQLANAEGRSAYLENRLAWFEENYADLKKENETMQSEVEELTLSLSSEKNERINSTRQYETRCISMEHHMHLLQEENRSKKKEYEDEINNSIRAQMELFILQRFLQDMEDKNYSLLTERQKHVEASKFAEKLISELGNETERLRLGLYHVFQACMPGSDSGFEDKMENELILVHEVIRNIDNIKQSATKHKDDVELLKVENLILLTLIHQMQIEAVEIESKKDIIKQELNLSTEKVLKLQHDKYRLVEMNDLLKSQVDKGIEEITVLQVGAEILRVKQGEVDKANMELQEKYFSLCQKCSDSEEENCMVKSENDVLLHERFSLVVVTTFLESFARENFFELKQLYEGMNHMTRIRDELEKDMNTLKEKLEMKEEENTCLKDLVQRFEMELQGVKDVLTLREIELSEAEERFKAEKCMNLENHVLKLSEVKRIQQKEIEDLIEMNANLMSELCKLHEVCEEHKNKEENLRTELKAKNNEFELCKGEATALYQDLQISSIQEVLYENMVHELTEMCGSLEDQTYSRTLEIQELIEKTSLMNTEIGELKAELLAYAPVIASLRDDVTSLERNTLRQLKLEVHDNSETKSSEATVYASISCQDKALDDQFCMSKGTEALQISQSRIRALEKALIKEIKKLVMDESPKSKGRRETTLDEIHEIVPDAGLYRQYITRFKGKVELENKIKLNNANPEASTSIKDILLDQVSDSSSYRWCKRATAPIERADDKMLELWEAAENSCLKQGARVRKKPSIAASKRHLLPDRLESARWKIEHHPNTIFEVATELSADKLDIQEVNNRKIQDRIASNARKLTSLQLIIENLNRKLETKKKNCKSKDIDLEMVEQQLREVQESVFKLKEFNSQCQLSGKHEEADSLRSKRDLVQARKGSETIGQLQIEVQKLESMLSKLENGMKSKGRNRFSRNKTTIILRDVIYNGKNTGKKKKAHLCGCFRPTNNLDTRRM